MRLHRLFRLFIFLLFPLFLSDFLSATAQETVRLPYFSTEITQDRLERPSSTLFLGNLKKEPGDQWDWRLWVKPYGNWANRQTDSGVAGFQSDIVGFMAGFDKKYSQRFQWGWSGGGSWISIHSTKDTPKDMAKNEVGAFKTLLSGNLEYNEWRVKFGGGYGYSGQNHFRNNGFGTFDGNNDADQYGVQGEFQLKMGSRLFEIEPFLAGDYFQFSEKAFGERLLSGSGNPLRYEKNRENSYSTTLGVRYRWRQAGLFAVWHPELMAGWFHEYGSRQLARSSQQDPFPTLYTFQDSEIPREHILFGAGFIGHMGNSMSVFAYYNADMAGSYSAHSILCGTYWNF
ncbi:MAG: autotransporter outer membrane beta-barrel domain-containing protein [Planctomycetaceae bacterium]|nr:autotransporter outer membrane beta-barrel domain-containing protein [Planctomycetaceae bacterium]